LPVEKKAWITQIALLFRPQLNYFEELISLTNYFFRQPNQQQLIKNKSQDLIIGELARRLEKTKE